jgi:hypothetical protein
MYKKQEKILKKISENLKKDDYNNVNTLKILKYLIEESSHEKIRISSIELIGHLNIKTYAVFEILEKCLLSDENPQVRAASAKLLILGFPKTCKNCIQWALKHETSPYVINIIENFSFGMDGHKLEFLNK